MSSELTTTTAAVDGDDHADRVPDGERVALEARDAPLDQPHRSHAGTVVARPDGNTGSGPTRRGRLPVPGRLPRAGRVGRMGVSYRHRAQGAREVVRRGPGRARDRRRDRAGRDGRAARAERRRQVDDDRHAARAARARRRHASRCSARRPSEAVDAGAVGAMLQTGALIRDLTVRELVAMMASLYPAPLDVDEVLELTGIDDDRRPADAEALGRRRRSACGSPSRSSSQPRPARARRADGRDGRRGAPRASGRRCASSPRAARRSLFATHYLEEADAYADRVVLMAHGRVVADGPPTEIKAMVGTRTIRATLPERRSRTLERLPGVDARRAARRGGRARTAPTPTRRSARCSPRFPDARDIEISGAGLEEAFLELTGRRRSAGHEPRLPPLRAPAHVPQPALLHLLARLPARPLLPDRRAEPQRARTSAARGLSAPLYFMVGLAAFGTMNAMLAAGARIAGERAGRLEPPAADHAADRRGRTSARRC